MFGGILSNVQIAFRLFCLIITISLSTYWTYQYFLNEDLISLEYKKYYTKEEDVYPILSLCITNPISEKKLKELNASFNASSYLKFLSGEVFEPSFLHIDYHSVIKDMKDYIEEDFIRYRNGSSIALHPDYKSNSNYVYGGVVGNENRAFPSKYAFFSDGDEFFNCYELAMPQERNIKNFWFRLNSNMFPNGIRPTSYGFLAILHYPNQLLIARTVKHFWPQSRNINDSYSMQFLIRGVEVIQRRQKQQRNCYENWKEFDIYIKDRHSNNVGCRVPYLDTLYNISMCSTIEQMKKKFYLQADDYGLSPPCREMKKITEKYEEVTLNLQKVSWARKGTFWISIIFPDEDFKEISQTR